MPEHKTVPEAAGSCGEEIGRQPIRRRVGVFANRIGVNDDEMRAVKIEAK